MRTSDGLLNTVTLARAESHVRIGSEADHVTAWRERQLWAHRRTFGVDVLGIWIRRNDAIGANVPTYFPIDAGVSFACDESDLIAVSWRRDNLSADFILPGVTRRAVRVRFNDATIVRLVDEFPLSTEQDTKSEGLVSRHFAYRVEGAVFAETQSEAWKVNFYPANHYRFITGWRCTDVLSNAVPYFEIVAMDN